jgi:hypothetical protein
VRIESLYGRLLDGQIQSLRIMGWPQTFLGLNAHQSCYCFVQSPMDSRETLCFVALGDKVIKYEKCCCFLPCWTLSGFATQNVPLLLSRSQSILKAIELKSVKIAKARLVVVNCSRSQILPSHTPPTPSHCFPSRSSSSWQVEFAAEKPPTCSQFVRRPSRPATGRLKSHHCPKSNKRGPYRHVNKRWTRPRQRLGALRRNHRQELLPRQTS